MAEEDKKYLDTEGLTKLIELVQGMPDGVTLQFDPEGGLRIKDAGITADKLAAGAVTKEKIASGAVDGSMLAPGSIGKDQIDKSVLGGASLNTANVLGKLWRVPVSSVSFSDLIAGLNQVHYSKPVFNGFDKNNYVEAFNTGNTPVTATLIKADKNMSVTGSSSVQLSSHSVSSIDCVKEQDDEDAINVFFKALYDSASETEIQAGLVKYRNLAITQYIDPPFSISAGEYLADLASVNTIFHEGKATRIMVNNENVGFFTIDSNGAKTIKKFSGIPYAKQNNFYILYNDDSYVYVGFSYSPGGYSIVKFGFDGSHEVLIEKELSTNVGDPFYGSSNPVFCNGKIILYGSRHMRSISLDDLKKDPSEINESIFKSNVVLANEDFNSINPDQTYLLENYLYYARVVIDLDSMSCHELNTSSNVALSDHYFSSQLISNAPIKTNDMRVSRHDGSTSVNNEEGTMHITDSYQIKLYKWYM